MLLDVPALLMLEVTVAQVVDMAFVLDRDMPAVGAVMMGCLIAHGFSSGSLTDCGNPFRGASLPAF